MFSQKTNTENKTTTKRIDSIGIHSRYIKTLQLHTGVQHSKLLCTVAEDLDLKLRPNVRLQKLFASRVQHNGTALQSTEEFHVEGQVLHCGNFVVVARNVVQS